MSFNSTFSTFIPHGSVASSITLQISVEILSLSDYIDNEVVDVNTINQYATIPSMEGLLTMFAGGLIEHVRNLSIGLNLYAEKLEEGGNN